MHHSSITGANSSALRRRLAGLSVLGTLGTILLAPIPLSAPASAARQSPEADSPGLWVSVDFKGGNATEYIEAIRRAAKTANIVVMPGVEVIEIPPLKLKTVALGSALEILDQQEIIADGTQYIIDIAEVEDDTITLTAEERQREGVSTNYTLPIYVVNVRTIPLTRNYQQFRTTSAQVWAVESLTDILSADHLLAAVDVALPLATENEPDIEIRFHEETGILIARGEIAALEMINQVIEQLEQTAYTRLAAEEETQSQEQLELGWEEQFSQLLQELEFFAEDRNEVLFEMAELQSIVESLVAELEDRNYQIQQLEEGITLLQNEMVHQKNEE